VTSRTTDSLSLGILTLLASCALGSARLVAQDYDFSEWLVGGYGESGYREVMRERVRSELSGREEEIWTFVKDSFRKSGSPSVGLRALVDLDGFNEKILSEYLEILEEQSLKVERYNNLSSRGPALPGIATEEDVDEYRRMGQSLGLISGSFWVFETYGNGLPREIAVRFLPLNDGGVQNGVADWYRVHGMEADIPVLEARADELESLGDQGGVNLLRVVIEEIRFRSAGDAPGLPAIVGKLSDETALMSSESLPFSNTPHDRNPSSRIAWVQL
jgi:hypothetical protein